MHKTNTLRSVFTVTLLLLYFSTVCLSNDFGENNLIRLVSYDDISQRPQRDSNFLIDSSFPSYPAEAIYQFGDSVADTGNIIRIDPETMCGKRPYGETYSDKPTGRCSDGLLIIDFFARYMNLPLLDPYLNKDGNFAHGVNFAVGGATALNASILEEKYNISSPDTIRSLSDQLEWLKSHLHSFYSNSTERRNKLAKALFIVGEFGGNDYNSAFDRGSTWEDVNKMVPDVVETVKTAVKEMIDLGATQIAIPGPFPLGCMSIYLHIYKTNKADMYDEVKCLKEYNIPIIYHNDLLQQAITDLRKCHPNVTVIFVDNYGAFREMLRHATSFGFNEATIEEPCFGSYKSVSKLQMNGVYLDTDTVSVCENPRDYISWDGLHLTQRAYEVLANQFIRPINGVARNSNIWGGFSFIIVGLFYMRYI